eukprot:PRCOL_00004817-RA
MAGAGAGAAAGRAGVDAMPRVGLGTWCAPRGLVGAAVKTALIDAGYRHIDCAPVYLNEREVGAAIAESGVPREHLWITSKLWNDRRRPADVREGVEQSLADLGTEYLDLVLIHWPVVWVRDTVMRVDRGASLKEAWQTLEALVDEGKARRIGLSNFSVSEVEEVLSYARVKPACVQVECHPRLPQRDLLALCKREGMEMTAYSPLGRGDASGLLGSAPAVEIAERLGVDPAAVVLGWNLRRGVAVIPKSVTPARVASNLAGAELAAGALTDHECERLDALEDGKRFCVAPWATWDDAPLALRAARLFLTAVAEVLFRLAKLDICAAGGAPRGGRARARG